MLNKVVLMGRLTKDPELKVTPTNISVTAFTIFINIVAWRSTAEFINKYFSKGQMIAVCGSIQTRTWDDNEGVRHYATEVVADEVTFCGDKRSGTEPSTENADFENISSDSVELPF